MAINLQKGQTIDLRKNAEGVNVYDLSSVTIGLGWDVRKKSGGFLSGIFGSSEPEFDLGRDVVDRQCADGDSGSGDGDRRAGNGNIG